MRVLPGAALLASAACSSGGTDGGAGPDANPPTPAPLTATVQATATEAFQPSSVSIRTGGTVTWTFGSLGHNVTFANVAGAPADIPGANTNTSIARTFPSAGSFSYQCTLHPGMSGTVGVSTPPPDDGGGGGGVYGGER